MSRLPGGAEAVLRHLQGEKPEGRQRARRTWFLGDLRFATSQEVTLVVLEGRTELLVTGTAPGKSAPAAKAVKLVKKMRWESAFLGLVAPIGTKVPQ